jgi:anti-sigma-K factor RskA
MAQSGPPNRRQPDDFQMDLIVKQVTEGLSPAEARALESLDGAVRAHYESEFERAAAAVAVAGSARADPLPPALRQRIEAQLAGDDDADDAAGGFSLKPSWNMAGWWAAAACLCLALFAWVRSPSEPLAVQLTAEEQRAALIANGSRKIPVGATKDPAAAGATGDVVWDPVTQRGFIHFVGLAHNDPAANQYQIWIFDAERDQRYPVDGGVFNVPANATDVLVPIRAALPVHDARAFAVTVEKPGGVVVSSRDRVVALAQSG